MTAPVVGFGRVLQSTNMVRNSCYKTQLEHTPEFAGIYLISSPFACGKTNICLKVCGHCERELVEALTAVFFAVLFASERTISP